MSLEQTKVLIEKALKDQNFYELLMNNPVQASQGYDLNESELGMIQGLPRGPYTQARRGLMETLKLVEAALEYAPPK